MSSEIADSGFSPILGESPRVLVLGTLPSQRSLQEQQYYGHPRNAFWWIMSELFGFEIELPYTQRTQRLTKQGVAVWDVVASCVRPGSMDADIDPATVCANDFSSLFQAKPSLKLVAFNGKAAESLFTRHVGKLWQGERLSLPSTSPAYAALSREKKLHAWRALKAYL